MSPGKTPKPKNTPAQETSRSLEEVVGPEVYRAWVSMLHTLVPGGRTHRLAPLLAAMLQYALAMAEDQPDDGDAADADATSLRQSLLATTEVSDPSEVQNLLHDAVARLFKDAGVEYSRASARGHDYSIAEDAYAEYVHWDAMPWE